MPPKGRGRAKAARGGHPGARGRGGARGAAVAKLAAGAKAVAGTKAVAKPAVAKPAAPAKPKPNAKQPASAAPAAKRAKPALAAKPAAAKPAAAAAAARQPPKQQPKRVTRAAAAAKAKAAAPKAAARAAPSTPAAAPTGNRASRIDSALKQILTSPSAASVAASASPGPAAGIPALAAAAAASTPAAAADLGQCRPWSRDDYFARVKTFKPSHWFAPPNQLSPAVCARYGWVCVGTDALGCRTCDRRITYRAPSSSTSSSEKDEDEALTAAIETFTARLNEAHTASCAWRKEACPHTFVEFPPSDAPALFSSFTTRLRDLLHYQRDTSLLPRVPTIENLAPGGELNDLGSSTAAPRNLAAVAGFPQTPAETAHTATMLALFGWTIRISNVSHGPSSPAAGDDENKGVLQCDLCGRTCGLWNFTALAPPKRTTRPKKIRRVESATAAAVNAKLPGPSGVPQTVEMLGCYKRGRHPALGGFEPQLVGQYRRVAPAAAAATGKAKAVPAPAATEWIGHFAAEAKLWAAPVSPMPAAMGIASRQNNKRRRSSGPAPPGSHDDLADGEDSYDPGEQEPDGKYKVRISGHAGWSLFGTHSRVILAGVRPSRGAPKLLPVGRPRR